MGDRRDVSDEDGGFHGGERHSWHGASDPGVNGHVSEISTVAGTEHSKAASRLLTFYKVLAVTCCYLFSVGSHYETHLYSSIKTDLKKGMGLTNSQFHVLSSVISLPNTVLPIMVGMLADRFGHRVGSLTATSLILTGTSIASLAVNLNMYPLLVLGRFIFGTGAGCIVTIQESILTSWFHGKSLALAVGIQITISRLSTYVSMSITSPITEWTGFYGYSVLVSSGFCLLSWLINILYIVATLRRDRVTQSHQSQSNVTTAKIPRANTSINRESEGHTVQETPTQNDERSGILAQLPRRDLETSLETPSRPNRLMSLKDAIALLPATYWLLLYTGICLAGCWSPFLDVTSEFLKKRFDDYDGLDTSWSKRGINSLLLPICLSGISGFIMDRVPKRRPYFVVLTCFLTLSAFLFLGYTRIHPVLGLVCFSLGLTIGPIAIICSMAEIARSSATDRSLTPSLIVTPSPERRPADVEDIEEDIDLQVDIEKAPSSSQPPSPPSCAQEQSDSRNAIPNCPIYDQSPRPRPPLVGTALGLYKCGCNISSAIAHPVVGRLQDADGDAYDKVIVLFCSLSMIAMLIASGAVCVGPTRVDDDMPSQREVDEEPGITEGWVAMFSQPLQNLRRRARRLSATAPLLGANDHQQRVRLNGRRPYILFIPKCAILCFFILLVISWVLFFIVNFS